MRPLPSILSAYLEACTFERSLSPNSLRAYQQDLQEFDEYALTTGVCWNAITREQIVQYRSHLRDTRDHSPATVRRRIVTLKAFYRWATKQEHCPDPFADLELDLKVPPRLPRPVDRPTLKSILSKTRSVSAIVPDPTQSSGFSHPSQNQVTDLAVRILIATGIRIGELVGLRIKDISGGGTRLRIIGKGNRERTVYLANEALIGDVQHIWRHGISERGPEGAFLLNARGMPLTEATFRKRLHGIAAKLSVSEPLTPHRFRHSAATLLIEEGVDIRTVQRLLGHASIATTEIYTRVSDTTLMRELQRADTLEKLAKE